MTTTGSHNLVDHTQRYIERYKIPLPSLMQRCTLETHCGRNMLSRLHSTTCLSSLGSPVLHRRCATVVLRHIPYSSSDTPSIDWPPRSLWLAGLPRHKPVQSATPSHKLTTANHLVYHHHHTQCITAPKLWSQPVNTLGLDSI